MDEFADILKKNPQRKPTELLPPSWVLTMRSAVETIQVLLSTMTEAFSSCKMQKLSNFNSFCISVHKLDFSVSLCYTLFTRRIAK